MRTTWMVETHGDPLGAVRQVLATVWEKGELDGILFSTGSKEPVLKEYPADLSQVNPFTPLMTINSAKFLPEFLAEHSDMHVGALLRPCEIRALDAKTKLEEFDRNRLLTICVDCLGTYPVDDFEWRVGRKGSTDTLSQESLQFARQGGIAAYRYRPACQTCKSPIGKGGDLNIGIFGLPVRQCILISARDWETVEKLQLQTIAATPIPELEEQRERTVAKILQRSAATRERITHDLSRMLPRDIDALIAQLEACGDCRTCLDNCPICAADFPARERDGRFSREDVMQWMISCAGCGMCEQSCPNHLPLKTIFAYIQAQLTETALATQDYVI